MSKKKNKFLSFIAFILLCVLFVGAFALLRDVFNSLDKDKTEIIPVTEIVLSETQIIFFNGE